MGRGLAPFHLMEDEATVNRIRTMHLPDGQKNKILPKILGTEAREEDDSAERLNDRR